MAISKNDCLLLLTELNEKGIDTSKQIKEVIKNNGPDLETLRFLNDQRQLDVTGFYEKLRRSYNNKKSILYINIVREKIDEPKELLTTLASLNLQILLYCKNLEDSNMFLKQSRFEEINKCLYNYARTYDLIPCQKLLKLIRADLMVLEYMQDRRK